MAEADKENKEVKELWVKCLLVIGSCIVSCTASEDFLKSDHKHRTHKAAERANELWCYKCSTMDIAKEYCMNVSNNDTLLHQKCDGDMRACMVKRISYTTTTNGSSNEHKLWSLERNCSQKCEPGCIIIGERLKLYKCTSCCEGKNFCNHGSGGSLAEIPTYPFFLSFNLILLTNKYNAYSWLKVSRERTKVRICFKCCESSFCNFGRGHSSRISPQGYFAFLCSMLMLLFTVL